MKDAGQTPVLVEQGNLRRISLLLTQTFARPRHCRGGTGSSSPPLGVDKLDLFEKHFKQGIAAYTVTPDRNFVLAHAPAHYDQLGRPTMTIGIFEEHAFLITDINKVTQNFTCGDCGARFTQAGNLSRHAKTCSQLAKPSLIVREIRYLPLSRLSKRPFIPTAVSESRLLAGSSTRPSSGAFTFTIKDVVTEVSALFLATRLMVITPKAKLSSSTTAVIGTGVPIVIQVLKKGLR